MFSYICDTHLDIFCSLQASSYSIHVIDWAYYVAGFTKRGLIADPNSKYLETYNPTCEFGPNIPPT